MHSKLRLIVTRYSRVLFSCLLVFSFLQTQAQTERTTYSGTVTDQDGKPIVGASVTTKDQRYGTKTDEEGKYSFSVPKTTSRNLVFSSVGFRPTEIRTGANTTFNVKLIKSNEDLDAVTVVGYGTKKKADLSGAVTEVGSEMITNQPITSVDQGLAGLVPGVTLREGSGAPGAGPEILIRGINGFGNNKPLIVIDDVIFEDGNDQLDNPLALINPEDIASLVILKDAASKAIYGSRATAGVILITTKKGVTGKAKINFNHTITMNSAMPFEKPDLLNAQELAQYRKEVLIDKIRADGQYNPATAYAAYVNPNVPVPDAVLLAAPTSLTGSIPVSNYINPSQYGKGTDWYDAIIQNAVTNNTNISVSGGNRDLKYFLSANYLNQDGIVKNNGIKRYALRGSLDARISDRIKMGFSFNPSRTDADRPADDPNPSQNLVFSTITSAYWADPSAELYQPNGTFNYTTRGKLTSAATASPLFQLYEEIDRRQNTQVIANTYLEIEPIKNLTIKSSINYSFTATKGTTFKSINLANDGTLNPIVPNPDSNRASLNNRTINNFINDNIIRYKFKLKRHNFNVMAAFSVQQNTNEGSLIEASKIIDGNFKLIDFRNISTSSPNNILVTPSYAQVRFLSQMGRINYSFADKYLVDFSLRRDASSRFGRQVRYGYFPAGSVTWRVTEENFMQNLKSKWLNDLRFEAGYGITGNARTFNGVYGNQGSFGNANYTFGGSTSITSGQALATLPNEASTWEESKQLDLGLNASLFKRRLNVAFNWYKQTTDGIIAQTSVSNITGFGSVSGNQKNSKVQNIGFEINLDYRIKATKDFKWTVGVNASRYQNKLVSYFLPQGFGTAASRVNNQQAVTSQIGEPLGMIRGIKVLGLYTEVDIADPKVAKYPNARVGGVKFADINGDGLLVIGDARDYTILANPHPDLMFGFNTMVKYKSVNIRAIFAGQVGGAVLDLRREFMWNGDGEFNIERQVTNRWRPGDDPTTKEFGSSSFNTGLNLITSDNKIYDGSYLALKNFTIGYDLTKALNSKKRLVENAEISVSIRNVFYLASYKYGNPEARRAREGSQARSINYGSYPIARSFSLGINLGF
jgi:TonB-dependent starch-binding outer membrane protein SusC